jgi:hypothetical protein
MSASQLVCSISDCRIHASCFLVVPHMPKFCLKPDSHVNLCKAPESHGRHTSWVRATHGRQAPYDEFVHRWSTITRRHAVWHGGALRALRQTISFRLHAKESTQVVLPVLCTNPWQIAVAVAHMSVQLLLHIHKFHAWDAAPAQTLPLEHPPRGPIHGRGQPGIMSFVSASKSLSQMTGIRKSSDFKANRRMARC